VSRGILSVVSGFSGAGKGTIVEALRNRYENYALSVSVTTRDPRPGETEGKSYLFRSVQEFEQMIEEDALLEHAKYVDNYYGTPRSYVEQQLASGKDVILEIEIQGALQVKEKLPEALLIFVTPPSIEVLKERLIGRGTETAEVIEARLCRASEEAEGMENYDYLLVNDDLDTAVETLNRIIQGEHHRLSRNEDFVNEIRTEAAQLKVN
jgi:guanylate kinase